MANKILISEFNSEEKLKPKNAFSLPEFSLFAKSNDLLMRGMDQLLITMADAGDIVVTSEKMDEEYLEFWNKEICPVKCVSPAKVFMTVENGSSARNVMTVEDRSSIYHRVLADNDLKQLLQENHIENYALVPDYYEMCSKLGLPCDAPSLDLVTELNSKVYSNEIKYKFDLPAKGIHLKSVEDYEDWITKYMKSENELQNQHNGSEKSLNYNGKWLIKDAMGVSGKGMLLLDSPGIADRLLLHFKKQEMQGAEIFDFIVEPYLKKKIDFSCLFTIYKDKKSGNGFTVTIDGYQKNESKGFAYRGTCLLEPEEMELITNSGYEYKVRRIAEDMAARGYWGCGCIDSMITEDDRVIPVLEINPRMSMSRFNMKMTDKVRRKCQLGYFEGKVTAEEPVILNRVINDLRYQFTLYNKGGGIGVIPLAPEIWTNKKAPGQRVRIYYIIVYDTQENYEEIFDAWFLYCSRSICAGNIT